MAGGGAGRSGEPGQGAQHQAPEVAVRRVMSCAGDGRRSCPKSETWRPENSMGNENNPHSEGVSKREVGV